MEHKKYNGWYNYETWVVKLWMDNEEPSYRYWQEETETVVKDADDRDEAVRNLADAVKNQHEEAQPEVEGVFADLIDAALSEVNWYEIAESMVDDYLNDNPESFAEEKSDD